MDVKEAYEAYEAAYRGLPAGPVVQAILAWALENLENEYELDYVSYDDQLNDDQIIQIFDGNWMDVEIEILDNWSDARYDSCTQVIKDLMEKLANEIDGNSRDLYNLLDRESGGEAMADLRIAIEERNTSNPFEELIRNKGSKLMRFHIGYEMPIEMNAKEQEDAVDEILALLGPHFPGHPANRTAIRSLMVENAYYGGDVSIIWYGSLKQVIDAIFAEENGSPDQDKQTITWTDPSILVLNSMSGAGYDAELKGAVTLPFKTENLRLDGTRAKHRGYCWDEVAGVHYGSYQTDVTIAATPA